MSPDDREDALLDEALLGGALLDEALLDEALLDEAFAALRAAEDPEPIDAEATLDRILETSRAEATLDDDLALLRDDARRSDDAARSKDAARDEATLARIQESVARAGADALRDEALRDEALRDEAHLDAGVAVLRPAPTRTAPARREGGARFLWAAAAAALLVVGVPTAWALTTGQLDRWFGAQVEPIREVPAHRVTPRRAATPSREAPPEALPAEPASAEPLAVAAPLAVAGPLAREVQPSEVTRSEAPASTEQATLHIDASRPRPRAASSRTARVRPSSEVVALAPAPIDAAPAPIEAAPEHEQPEATLAESESPERRAEREQFAAAHRAHFVDANPPAALALWDDYLAGYPGGRYALEARYNRALTLVRLGRHEEARQALTPFADGAYGSYRRLEAARLVEAIDAR